MKRKAVSGLRYVFLTIVSLFSVFPLYWMLIAATNKNADIIRGALLPGLNLVENYKTMLASQRIWPAMRTSFLIALGTTLIALLVCSIAGYGFEIYHSRNKDRLMTVLLMAMMVPFAATMIPLFQMFSSMRMINNIFAVILPTVSTPFLIMMFRQSARSFPHDIIEAARIDGLAEIGIFFRMFFPTMRSTYAAAMTIVFMNAWNNYLWPKIILQTDVLTMPMAVSNMIQGYLTDYGAIMTAVLICTLPTVIVFFVLQRSFAEGITGSVKQ
ncbi:MAG: carbohydrate ABC transporter permease [Clostridiales bacterium]|jgi:lactose/L-arabinose transport system permease protein|nr:carbohydrate ABC transporter permease [Clostridiales bacterium]